MKIFMLCNVSIPMIAHAEGSTPCVFGGWLDDVSRFLSKENELTICYMNDRDTCIYDSGNTYVGFKESRAEETLLSVLNDNCFDVFHIWGTEYEHSSICVSILEKMQLLDRCIVSIQGLVSVYAEHYLEGIPEKYLHRRTLQDWIRGNDITTGLRSFEKRGKLEIDLLKKVKHVIGRTSWDKACLWAINDKAIYHKCNENLRECFYDNTETWDINHINYYSIFVSQCSYPVKGFHYLLKAMPLILEKYPNARIITTGEDFLNVKGRKKHLKGAYRRYLCKLIKDYGLQDRIVFKGLLSSEQMKEEYISANVFVCCSTIENSPNSLGEAMMSGCPVVSSFVGGTKDMIKSDYEGYLYQTSSAEFLAYYICKVFENDEKVIQMSKNARIKALATHDKIINNNNMLAIYREVSGRS